MGRTIICFKDSYEKTYGKRNFFAFLDILEITMLTTDSEGNSQSCIDGKNRGMYEAISDWKKGLINRVNPSSYFKNNNPLIKLF